MTHNGQPHQKHAKNLCESAEDATTEHTWGRKDEGEPAVWSSEPTGREGPNGSASMADCSRQLQGKATPRMKQAATTLHTNSTNERRQYTASRFVGTRAFEGHRLPKHTESQWRALQQQVNLIPKPAEPALQSGSQRRSPKDAGRPWDGPRRCHADDGQRRLTKHASGVAQCLGLTGDCLGIMERRTEMPQGVDTPSTNAGDRKQC